MLEILRGDGVSILIVCTMRTAEEQSQLYSIGRDEQGNRIEGQKVVTNAKAGKSLHNFGRAFDCVPMVSGKPIWDDKGNNRALWEKVGAAGESAGLEWSGRWRGKLRELGHFQRSFASADHAKK